MYLGWERLAISSIDNSLFCGFFSKVSPFSLGAEDGIRIVALPVSNI